MINKNAILFINRISDMAIIPRSEGAISKEISAAISLIGKSIPEKEFPLIFANAIMNVDNVYDRSCANNIIKALCLQTLSPEEQLESFNISNLAVDCISSKILKSAKKIINDTNDPVILSKKISLSVFYSKNNYEQSMILRVFEKFLNEKHDHNLSFNC